MTQIITLGPSGGVRYPEVVTFADLPEATANNGAIYVVLSASGIWPFNRKQSGLYYSNGAVWDKLNNLASSDIADMYEANSDVNRYSNADKSSVANAVQNASNVGIGASLFKDKEGTNLRFRTIRAGDNVTITAGTDTLTISSTGGGGGGDSPSNSYFPSGW